MRGHSDLRSRSKVGGLLHYLLPISTNGEADAATPLKFGSLAIPELFKTAYTLGRKEAAQSLYGRRGSPLANVVICHRQKMSPSRVNYL